MSLRLAGRYGYPKDDPFRPGVCHQNQLEKPVKWKKPRMIFVCSMGDLFHEKVNIINGCRVLSYAEMAQQHTYLFLTKRPAIMRDAFEFFLSGRKMPKNWWIGVTAENQKMADERIPILLQIPASVRFVSVEPMLSSINLSPWLGISRFDDEAAWSRDTGSDIDWVICGGETGPGARIISRDWVISLRNQCVSAKVPFFFKKWGSVLFGKTNNPKNHMIDGEIWEEYPR
jgi:protein gp37